MANESIDTVTGSSNDSVYQQRVVELINQERSTSGLPLLTRNNQLETAADLHSQDMADRDYFSHTGLDGSSAGDRITASGYNWSRVAENIAAGQSTPEQVVKAWMDSPGHRANILNPNLHEIGIGYDYLSNDVGNVNFSHYWTADFGTIA